MAKLIGPRRRRGSPRQFTRAEIDHMREMSAKSDTMVIARLYRTSQGTVLRAIHGRMKGKDEP